VIDAISKYYEEINANIHHGVHTLSQLATDASSRENSESHQRFCPRSTFTSGTTFESNLVANGLLRF
jgi:cysteine desulfurase/selenocysteine lyase